MSTQTRLAWTTVHDDSAALGFVIQMRMEGTHAAEVRVLDTITVMDGVPYFGDGIDDMTHDADTAPVYLTGSVKWDGCLNIDFPELTERGTLLHFCGRSGVAKFSALLPAILDAAAKFIPTWNEEVAG